jgi:photosystem II stability/assembly factor-like uncharacterized protein
MTQFAHPTFRRLFGTSAALAVIVAIGGLVPGQSLANGRPTTSRQYVQSLTRSVIKRDLALAALIRSGVSVGALSDGSDLARLEAMDSLADSYPARAVTTREMLHGIAQANAVKRAPHTAWKELGPLYAPHANAGNPQNGAATAVSGRAAAFAVVPSTCSGTVCKTMYAGAANGGIWKTLDGGKTWKALLDLQNSTAVGSIGVDPKNPNIVYVGTGEPNHSGDSHYGVGILRSSDAGKSWTLLGENVFGNRAVGTIIVDPRTAETIKSTLFVTDTNSAAGEFGDPCVRSTKPFAQTCGFFISNDGGAHWRASNPKGASIGAESLVMNPKNPNELYAGFQSAGVFRSENSGKTWTNISKGLPTSLFDRISLAIAPSAPSTVYAAYNVYANPPIFGFPASGSLHLYVTTNRGASWTFRRKAPNSCGGQCDYDMPLAVDPTNAKVVYLGGSANYDYLFSIDRTCSTFTPLASVCNTALMRSSDAGTTWTDVSENGNGGPLHPDDHIIVIDPRNHNVVYTGGDGGIFHSSNAGQTWNDLNKGLGTLQFTGVAVAANGQMYAGTQDNGTFKYQGSTTWNHVFSGDGGYTAVNPKNSKTVYVTNFGTNLFRSTDGGRSGTFIAPFGYDFNILNFGAFYEPYVLAPKNPNDIFWSTYRIWRSQTGGGTDGNGDGDATNDSSDKSDWVPISFDLSCSSQPTDPNTTCPMTLKLGGGQSAPVDEIISVAVSDQNSNYLAAGTVNGHLWVTNNALAKVKTDASCTPWNTLVGYSLCDYLSGPKWVRVDRNGLPNRAIRAIKFAPGSTSTIYAALAGYDENTPGHAGHVFVTHDFGKHWADISGTGAKTSLPDVPLKDLVVNPKNGHLYAGGFYGVYASINQGNTWERLAGIPNSPVYQMQFDAPRNQLVAATHGRGIWETAAP